MLSIYLHDFEFGPGLHRSHFTIQPDFLCSTLYSTELLWEILKRTGPRTGSCWAPPVSAPQLDQCHHSLNAAFVMTLQGLHPEQMPLFAHKSFRQCPNPSYVQLLLHPPLHHDLQTRGWFDMNIMMQITEHEFDMNIITKWCLFLTTLSSRGQQSPPRCVTGCFVSSLRSSSFLHPLKAGTVCSFLRHPHSLTCSQVLHRLLQLFPWVPLSKLMCSCFLSLACNPLMMYSLAEKLITFSLQENEAKAALNASDFSALLFTLFFLLTKTLVYSFTFSSISYCYYPSSSLMENHFAFQPFFDFSPQACATPLWLFSDYASASTPCMAPLEFQAIQISQIQSMCFWICFLYFPCM